MRPFLNSAYAISFSEKLGSLSDNSHAGYGVNSGGAGGLTFVQSVHWLGRRCSVDHFFLQCGQFVGWDEGQSQRVEFSTTFLYSMSSLLVRVETRASVMCVVLPT